MKFLHLIRTNYYMIENEFFIRVCVKYGWKRQKEILEFVVSLILS
ncbi:MAG: hypothetical protein ACI857_002422 [Arenicella sp.]